VAVRLHLIKELGHLGHRRTDAVADNFQRLNASRARRDGSQIILTHTFRAISITMDNCTEAELDVTNRVFSHMIGWKEVSGCAHDIIVKARPVSVSVSMQVASN
jgi:hypothetical protein